MPEIELSDRAQEAAQHYVNNAGSLGPPSTWGEIWDANWNRGKWGVANQWQIEKKHQDALRTAVNNEIVTAHDMSLEEYAKMHGMPLLPPLTPEGVTDPMIGRQMRYPRERQIVPLATTTKYLNDVVDTLDPETQKRIAPFRDVRGLADKEAVKIHDDATAVDRTTYGVGGYLWGSMAGLAANATTPESVFGTLVGGVFGAGAGLGGRLAAGFLSNVVPQAAIEPLEFQERARLGLDPTIAGSVTNILAGGAVGAGINVLPMLAAPLARSVSQRFMGFGDRLANDLDLQNRARPYDANDFHTMAKVAERNEVTGPLPGVDETSHEAKIKAARDAVDSGGSVAPTGEVTPSRPAVTKPPAVDPVRKTPEPGPAKGPELAAPAVAKAPAALAEAPAPQVLKRETYVRAIDERIDMGEVAKDVTTRVEAALARGDTVTYFQEDRPVDIVAVVRGMMADAQGQRWGTLPLLSPTPGKRTEVVITPMAEAAAAPAAPAAPEAVTPAAPVAKTPADYLKLDPDISASDYSARMAELRANKPRPIEKLWKDPSKADPEKVAAAKQDIKDWNKEYRQVSKNQKLALERDNAAFAARQAAAATPEAAPTVKTAGDPAVAQSFDTLVDDVVARAQQRRPGFTREDLKFEVVEDNVPKTVTAKQLADDAQADVTALTELKACAEGNKP